MRRETEKGLNRTATLKVPKQDEYYRVKGDYSRYSELDQTFKVLITESKRNEIKRMIGSAFLCILKQETFRKIINRQSWHRTNEDNRRLVLELRRHKVFKQFYKLKDDDFMQIARSVTFSEYKEGDIVQKEFDPIKCFNIILRGQLRFEERNKFITDWNWAKTLEK